MLICYELCRDNIIDIIAKALLRPKPTATATPVLIDIILYRRNSKYFTDIASEFHLLQIHLRAST